MTDSGIVASRAALAAGPVIAVAILGGYVTAPSIPGWYATLAKPPGTPPDWVFGPVWTVLYAAMIVAVWRILALPPATTGRTPALACFFVQLALNCAWSVAFFGARNPLLGIVVIAALLVAIALTIRLFWARDPVAGALLVPYLLWVGYATYLNLGVWRLNV